MKVAVIGLGSIGGGMAANLVHDGHEVHGCDIREAARATLTSLRGHVAQRPSDLPRDLDAVVIAVVTAEQTANVLFGPEGCVPLLRPGSVVLLCSTVSPETAGAIASRLADAGLLALDAPVSGGSKGADAGTLTVMASGSDAAFASAAPVLNAIAGKVWRLGEAPGAGSTVKMVNQLLAGIHIAAAGEAIALGIRAGADPRVLHDVICSSAGSSWMFQDRVPHVLAGDDAPRSTVDIFVKDLGIVLGAGQSLRLPLPLAASAHQLFLAVAGAGHGARDDAFVIRFWEAAGVTLPRPASDAGRD